MIEFYNQLPAEVVHEDYYTRACSGKAGLPLKQFVLKRDFGIYQQFYDPDYKWLLKRMAEYPYVNIMPCDDFNGNLYGFCYRYSDGSFYGQRFCEVAPFGFEDFKDYKAGMPLIIVEGIKDVRTVKLVYPYAIASLTAWVSDFVMSILLKMTSNIIIIKDRDKTGDMVSRKYKKKYKNNVKVYGSAGEKDMGEYWEDDVSELEKRNMINYLKIMMMDFI